MRGLGTLLNIATVLVGSSAGVLIGGRLPQRTRDVVTDGIGLVTLMVAVLDGASVLAPALGRAVGTAAPVLIVLGSVLIGGISGSALRIEDRLDQVGAALQRRLQRFPGAAEIGGPVTEGVNDTGTEARTAAARPPRTGGQGTPTGGQGTPAGGQGTRAGGTRPVMPGAPTPEGERERFIQGFVTASMIYCVGPLTILGSLQDGLGQGFSQLALKSTLDGFTSIALAASLGWGVAASALSVLVVEGGLTAAAAAAGGLMTQAQIAAMTATGGLLLAGLALRLLRLRAFPVADLLPALAVAPLLTELVTILR